MPELKSIVATVKPEKHKAIKRRAIDLGVHVSDYVRDLIDADLQKAAK